MSKNGSKILEISGRLLKPLALCHSGQGLYQDRDPVYLDKDSTQGLNKELYYERLRNCQRWPDVEVCVDKDRYIYDRDMPQMAYEIEEVKRGDWVKGMIVDATSRSLQVTL